jgi:hypothetical protein
MKRITLTIGLAAVMMSAVAKDWTENFVEKKKTYTKTYSLSSSEKATLKNSFGELKIVAWDRNEIKVDVSITAKASSETGAQKILDNIRIEDGKNSSGVYFKTVMDNQNWNKDKKSDYKEQGMKIDYVVYMPAGNALDATNEFGSLIMPSWRGEVTLTSKFGSLDAGILANVREILVEFGKAKIEQVNNGKITVKFSKGDIRKISGTVETKFEFCEMMKINLDGDLRGLNMKSSYSTVELGLGSGLSANFDITTSFGDCNNNSKYNIREEKDEDQQYGPKFDKRFIGTAGGGSAKVRIKSDFGKIRLI